MKTEEIIDILESLVGGCVMKPKDSEKLLKAAATRIMKLTQPKEECANYARYKAEVKQHKGYHMSDGDTSTTHKAVTDGEMVKERERRLQEHFPVFSQIDAENKKDKRYIYGLAFEAGVEWMREQQGEGAKERYEKGVLQLNETATSTGEFGYIVVCELMKIASGLTDKK